MPTSTKIPFAQVRFVGEIPRPWKVARRLEAFLAERRTGGRDHPEDLPDDGFGGPRRDLLSEADKARIARRAAR